ncbi:MAG: molybdate ABC transporter substrate-binding protein [Thermomicrobiales bacterium]
MSTANPDPDAIQRLSLFLPGAFAGMADELRAAYRAVDPDAELAFHDFIPSGLLARAILDGAPADVYVSANIRYMEDLRRAGLIRTARILAGNRLCIIVRPDRAAAITGLNDLCRPSVRVVTPPAATDPCGQYVEELFARAGIIESMASKAARGELIHSRGSGDLPSFLRDGRSDAGIFYASEAQALGGMVVTVNLPVGLDLRDRIAFTIGTLERGCAEHSLAERFVEFAVGTAGQRLLQRHGFLYAAEVDLSLPRGIVR